MYKHRNGIENPSYTESNDGNSNDLGEINMNKTNKVDAIEEPKRENWGNDIEFLMSCIALSVGLGNVWRFPFVALENGGGAFLIPYIITLILVGKPIYYLEMILGQFSSRANLKLYDYAPIMRGIAYGQTIALIFLTTYYSSLMALTLHYLVDSFYATLPWSYCREEWGDLCIDSKSDKDDNLRFVLKNVTGVKKSSTEFYFTKVVLQEKSNIDDGIGVPNWKLVLTLAVAWIVITVIIFKGIKSSGKVSYFLAIFPYVILSVLLIRALTLPGAFDGVLFFLTPQWDKLLNAKVWYAAVTQVFFSLTVCYGVVVMYASFNRFNHNIRRDCNIVTSLDTFTSLLSGIVIFGILGNLAHESNNPDIKSVVKDGPSLAFISYPEAITKFPAFPQVFSVFFFLMLFILGIGSNVGIMSTVVTIICDQFPQVKRWIIVSVSVLVCFGIAIIYITPGGQFIITYIDFFAVTLIVTVLGVFELISASWIYGVKNISRDIKFMLGVNTSIYYRICWSIITPIFMAAVYIYMLVDYKPLTYNNVRYPDGLYAFGWCMTAIGIGQLFVWASYAVWKRPELSFEERFKDALKPTSTWGPLDPTLLSEYKEYVRNFSNNGSIIKKNFWSKIYDNIFS